MIKKGRPKIYYDFSSMIRKKTIEPLDLCLKERIITLKQHKLAIRLRWLFTVNFGLPTVQGYNINRIRGKDISKYQEYELYEIQSEYRRITEYLFQQDKKAAKLWLDIVIHHKMPKLSIENVHIIKCAADLLEQALNVKKITKIYDNRTEYTY